MLNRIFSAFQRIAFFTRKLCSFSDKTLRDFLFLWMLNAETNFSLGKTHWRAPIFFWKLSLLSRALIFVDNTTGLVFHPILGISAENTEITFLLSLDFERGNNSNSPKTPASFFLQKPSLLNKSKIWNILKPILSSFLYSYYVNLYYLQLNLKEFFFYIFDWKPEIY